MVHTLGYPGSPERKLRDKQRAEADQRFFEANRKLSPKFPDVATILERRQQYREKIAARVLLTLCAACLGLAVFTDQTMWHLIDAAVCFVGFVITCFVAGNRATVRAGGSRGRPF